MPPPSQLVPVPLVDWAKALASMTIVWHHLCLYGPMARSARPLAPDLIDWLADPARQAVQVFLVVSGFLAARSLMPQPDQPSPLGWVDWPIMVAQRFVRLMRPAWPAMVLAVAGAALARNLMDDPDTPDAPTLTQLLANALLLHDIVEIPALSAGLWYLAIDLQLFALLALLSVVLNSSGLRDAPRVGLAWSSLLWLVVMSLWVWNRDTGLDMWALYFVGSYGLGVMAHWVQVNARPMWMRMALLALVVVSLWLEWRSRLALAGLVALWLSHGAGGAWLAQSAVHARVRWLSRVSYCVFLVHYPVSLVANALFSQIDNPPAAVAWVALAATCAVCIQAGHWLHSRFEAQPVSALTFKQVRQPLQPDATGTGRPTKPAD